MTTLANPTIESQLNAATDPWSDCGEADVASVVNDAGTPVSVTQVVGWALSSGQAITSGRYAGETSAPNLAAELAHWGVSAQVRYAPLSQTIPAALSRRHEVIVLIDSNNDGLPSAGSGIGHWLLAFGDSNGDYQVMQPLGSPPGSLQSYSQSLLQSADQQEAVEIMQVLPKDQTAASPPPPYQPPPPVASSGSPLPGLLVVGGGLTVVGYALWRRPDLRRDIMRPLHSF